jgi:hypothetical protein
MTKTIVSFAIALALSASAFFAHTNGGLSFAKKPELRFAGDGAFRDGLYLGKLAAQSHQLQRPAVGRWSSDHDRASFTAGYRLGYDQGAVLTGANSTAARSE